MTRIDTGGIHLRFTGRLSDLSKADRRALVHREPVDDELVTGSVRDLLQEVRDAGDDALRILEEAESSGTVVYFTDIWNLATVGKTSRDPACLLDAVRPFLEAGRVQLIGEATPDVVRTMQRVPGFSHLFQQVPVALRTQEGRIF